MGLPPRSCATDAYHCIMVEVPAGPAEYKCVARSRGTTASSPRIGKSGLTEPTPYKPAPAQAGITRPPWVEEPAARTSAASRARRTKSYRNIPCSEADESSIDEIKVLDPRHPLYGRSFRVLRRSTHRGGNFPPSYEVEYRNGSSLLIPVAATEWHDSPNDQLKLCH